MTATPTSPPTPPTSTPSAIPSAPVGEIAPIGTAAAPGRTGPTGSPSGPGPRPRFVDLVAAEWIKLRSLRSTYWVLGAGAAAVIGMNVYGAIARYRHLADWSARAKAHYNWLNEAFGQSPYLLLMLAAGTIGALALAGEHATGLIRTTFTAVPARRSVVAAKVVVVGGVMTAVGLVIALTSFGVTQAILSGRDAGFSLGDEGVMPALVASVVIVPVAALVGMGVGAVVRHTAAAVVAVFAVLILLPELTKGTSLDWVVHVHESMPWSAWGTLRASPIRDEMPAGLFPWSPAGSWAVLVIWPLVSAIIALVVVHRREV